MPNGRVQVADVNWGVVLVVKFATRLSSAGAGATGTSCTLWTAMRFGGPLLANVIGDGNAGPESVDTGSHCTAGTVNTKIALLELSRKRELTASGLTDGDAPVTSVGTVGGTS